MAHIFSSILYIYNILHSYRSIDSIRRFAIIENDFVVFQWICFQNLRISCCGVWYAWWRRQYLQSSKMLYYFTLTSDMLIIANKVHIFHCCINVTHPNITYLLLLSCDKNKEFLGNLFLEWIEEFPWLMFWMIALINKFDNIYINFLTSPKISYSSEVVFTICDVRKVDLNRFNVREVHNNNL